MWGEDMIVPKIAICPICGKKTYLRIEDGGYLNEYPIRVNCINCRALIKGVYIMSTHSNYRGVHLINADVEECDVDSNAKKIKNADYVADISGELPCKNVREFDGHLIYSSPYLEAAGNVESIENRIKRLSYFNQNMDEWKRKKSTAFQLLDEGSIEYIAKALSNRMGEYLYECDNYLKSLQCLQEVVLEETKYLFLEPEQDAYMTNLIKILAQIDKNKLHQLAEQMGGIHGIVLAYKKTIEVFSSFMNIYPNVLPAETYIRFKNKDIADIGIATCSFSDIKTFYQDAYEALVSLMYVPVCLDNIMIRGDYFKFAAKFNKLFIQKKYTDIPDDYHKYLILDNGMKLNMLNATEALQGLVDIPANKSLRNGIGHNNIKYDGITQIITAFDLKDHSLIKFQGRLMDVAIDCLGLAKSAIIMSEIILFILRHEFRAENVRSIIHPRFYKGAQPNDKCPCGSGLKYKKCCRNDVENISRDLIK